MMNEFNPDGKDIRFIDSHYRDLFRIPDGGTIQVHYSDDSVVIKPCKFIDEYHTQIGNNVFHICQFAELLERNGSYCQAEPEIMGDEAAWQVGRDQYLAIQTCEDGYDYTLFDKEFHEIDGGQLDNPELSMLEARAEILAGFGLQMRELRVQVSRPLVLIIRQAVPLITIPVHIHLRSLCVNMLTIFYIKSAVIVLCVIGSMLA